MSVITVDDQDPSVIQVGTWFPSGTPNEYRQTTSVALADGATMTLNFTGTQIGVYGTLDNTSGGIVATYAIDTVSPATVTYQAVQTPLFHQPFWQSNTLRGEQHQLVVTVTNVNSTSVPKTGHVWFDYFTYTAIDNTTSTSTSTTTSGTSTSSNTQATTPNNTSKSGSNLGVIVGATIGGAFFLLACVALALFFFCRSPAKQRRTSRRVVESGKSKGLDSAQIQPFLADKNFDLQASNTLRPNGAVTPFSFDSYDQTGLRPDAKDRNRVSSHTNAPSNRNAESFYGMPASSQSSFPHLPKQRQQQQPQTQPTVIPQAQKYHMGGNVYGYIVPLNSNPSGSESSTSYAPSPSPSPKPLSYVQESSRVSLLPEQQPDEAGPSKRDDQLPPLPQHALSMTIHPPSQMMLGPESSVLGTGTARPSYTPNPSPS